MLNDVQLEMIKENNNNEDLLYLSILGQDYVFKMISPYEYRHVMMLADNQEDLEDMICQLCIVYPEDFSIDNALASVPKLVFKEILRCSGISDMNYIMDKMLEKKSENNYFFIQCQNIVKAAFPEYSYDDIKQWTWNKLIEYAVRAEAVINMRNSGNLELQDTRENIENTEEKNSATEDYKNVGHILRMQGIDPILQYGKSLVTKNDIMDYPLLGGLYWNEDGVLNEIRKQINKHK